MPRRPYQISKSITSTLLKECESTFGFNINHQTRYVGLSKSIEKKCKEYISPKTISRAFSKEKKHSCSKHTLDIFANYCGYNDVETYSKLYAREEVRITKEEFKILKEIYNYKNYYVSLEYRDPVLMSISKIIVSKLRESTEDYLDLVNEYSDNPVAQNYFIEQSIDYDNLAIHYHKALKTYLQNKHDKEAKIFGNSVLYLNAFLTQNEKQCNHYYRKVISLTLDDNIHPFVIGRYFSTVILHEKIYIKKDISHILKEILTIEKTIKKEGRDYMKFPGFHFTICDSLIKCGEYDVAKTLINSAFTNYPDGQKDVDDGYYEAMYLFMAICSHNLNDYKTRDRYYKLCQKIPYNFLSQKYYSIQQKLLELNLPDKKKKQIKKDLEVLIHHTKFSYFQTELNKWTL